MINFLLHCTSDHIWNAVTLVEIQSPFGVFCFFICTIFPYPWQLAYRFLSPCNENVSHLEKILLIRQNDPSLQRGVFRSSLSYTVRGKLTLLKDAILKPLSSDTMSTKFSYFSSFFALPHFHWVQSLLGDHEGEGVEHPSTSEVLSLGESPDTL